MLLAKLLAMAAPQLTALNGSFLLLIGCCSLYFNYNDAKRKNHQRAALAARIGGWFYMACGLAIIIKSLL